MFDKLLPIFYTYLKSVTGDFYCIHSFDKTTTLHCVSFARNNIMMTNNDGLLPAQSTGRISSIASWRRFHID